MIRLGAALCLGLTIVGCRPVGVSVPATPAAVPSEGAASDIEANGPPAESSNPTDDAAPCPALRVQATLDAINELRRDRGLGILRPNARLAAAAEAHALDLVEHGMRGHRGSDGSMPSERATRAGYSWRLVGENVAGGYSTPTSVVGGWMASAPHRENLLNRDFREAGIAAVPSGSTSTGIVWVLVLGDRADVPRGPPGCVD